ncbi:MAG: T9SS type A sorting domain-containing protein, partial [Saprospiraceae bacterium]
GVYINAPNSLFKHNIIENTGYDALYFHGDDIIIEENYIDNFLLVKTSGGGIHTYDGDNSGRQVLNNIVVNGMGNADGTDTPDNYYAYGIHLNGGCTGITVNNNSVGHIRGEAIAFRSVQDVDFTNNTIFGGSFSQFTATNYNTSAANSIRNLDLTNNIFFATEVDALVAEIYTLLDDVNQFGNWNNNYYCRPLNPTGTIRRVHHPDGTWSRESFNLDRWNDTHTHDENSGISPLTISAFAIDNYLTNNLLSNGNFDTDDSNWGVWGPEGNYTQSRVTNQLDAGCLQHEFTSTTPNSDSYILGISERLPAVQIGETYLLNYSIKGVNNTAYDLLFRRDGSPYTNVATRPTYFLTNARQEVQHLFEITEADDIPRLDFLFYENNEQTWLDNINLRKVAITPTNPEYHFRFLYNPTTASQSFPLDDTYTDVYGNTHTSSVNLQPYTSMILMSENAVIVLPIELFDFSGELVDQAVNLDWEIGEATNFSFFEIQRSLDGKAFQPIGKIYPEIDQSYFDFTDLQAAKRQVPQLYYRLKMVDTDGSFSYSPLVVINLKQENKEIQVYPNPTTGMLYFQNGTDSKNVEIFNSAGQLVKTKQLAEGNLDLNDLATGVYFIKISTLDGSIQYSERITLQR